MGFVRFKTFPLKSVRFLREIPALGRASPGVPGVECKCATPVAPCVPEGKAHRPVRPPHSETSRVNGVPVRSDSRPWD